MEQTNERALREVGDLAVGHDACVLTREGVVALIVQAGLRHRPTAGRLHGDILAVHSRKRCALTS